LKLFACVLSVSAALGGHPIIKIPAKRGRNLRSKIVHDRVDAEGDPRVHDSQSSTGPAEGGSPIEGSLAGVGADDPG